MLSELKPGEIYMTPRNGRVYYIGPSELHKGKAIVESLGGLLHLDFQTLQQETVQEKLWVVEWLSDGSGHTKRETFEKETEAVYFRDKALPRIAEGYRYNNNKKALLYQVTRVK